MLHEKRNNFMKMKKNIKSFDVNVDTNLAGSLSLNENKNLMLKAPLQIHKRGSNRFSERTKDMRMNLKGINKKPFQESPNNY